MSQKEVPGGLVGAGAVLVALAGAALWLSMLAGPWRLATGLLDARTHLNRTENTLSTGAIKLARYETLAGAAAARRAESAYESTSPLLDVLQFLPIAGDALDETDHLVAAAELSADAALGLLDIADNALEGPDRIIASDPDDPQGESRVRLERVAAIATTVTEVRADLRGARRELEAVDLTKLPRRARPAIGRGIAKAKRGDELLADAERGLELLPAFLGADAEKTYLIAMQNPAELRGTGGSILQFSTLTFEDGRARFDSPKTVYKIDRERAQVDIPLPEDAWYVRGIPDARRFGNANWSPDWPLSAQLTARYGQAREESFSNIDGVIAMDPFVLQEMLPGVGAYRTPIGNRISSRTSVHFLLHRGYGRYPHAYARRKALTQVVEVFYDRVFDPAHPSLLVQGIGDALAHKHIQIWLGDEATQRFVEHMNWDGSIPPAKNADYLSVVQQNVGGNKLDYHADQVTTMTIEPRTDDTVVSTTVRVTNNVFLPLPQWPLGNSGPFHRPMINVYVPGRAALAGLPGGEVYPAGHRIDSPPPAEWVDGRPAEHSESGKKVWSATLGDPSLIEPGIPPGETGTIRFNYVVPGTIQTIDGRAVYRLVVQYQPKPRPETLQVQFALPKGAQTVIAPGFKRDGDVLTYERRLDGDIVLEVSWRA
jgi:hypothetical protein